MPTYLRLFVHLIRLALALAFPRAGEEHGGQGEAGDDGQFDGGEGSVVKRAEG